MAAKKSPEVAGEFEPGLFTVLDPVQHNGKDYRPGDSLKLPDEQSLPLLALGVIEPQ